MGGLQRLVELLETIILGSEAALGGSVDDEDNLALVVCQWHSLALLCLFVSACIAPLS